MTGNWWFPYDYFVVAQGNGDLHFYGPGIVGSVYQWDAITQTYTSPPGFFDAMVSNGNGWTRTTKHGDVWQFNAAGHLTTITNRYGLTLTFNRNAQQAITSIVDYAGRSTTVSYNASGYVSSVTDWGGRSTTFTYTAQGYLATITKPATTFYDRQTSSIVTRGKKVTFTYTSGTGTALDGNLLTATDDRGNVLYTNTYDGSDRNTATTLRGRTWNHTYLPGGGIKVVDPDSVTTIYSFDAVGAITKKEVFTNTGLGQTPLRTGEPNSYVWLYERNAACGCGYVTKITRPDGSTIAFAWDAKGNLLSETADPAPGVTGDQIKHTWTYSTQYSEMLTHVWPEGYASGANVADHTTTWTRDATGSVTQIKFPKAKINGTLQHPVVTFTRNSAGFAVTRTTPGGRQDSFTWAANTYYLTKVVWDTPGSAIEMNFTPDTYGRLASVSDPRSNVTTFTYNALDQITEVAPPIGSKTTFLYDNNDNLYRVEVENKDANGVVDSQNPWFTTTRDYTTTNFLSSVTTEIDATSTATTNIEWTPGGRLKKVTDPNGDVVEYEYDERGLPFKVKEAPGTSVEGVTTFNYSLNGPVSEVIDPRGNSLLMSQDHVDRPVKITLANGTESVAEFDRNGRVVQAEAVDSQGLALSRTSWERDPRGVVTKVERHHLDAQGATVSRDSVSLDYTADWKLKKVTDPLGNDTTYAYNVLARLTTVTDAASNKREFVYDAAGNVTEVKRRDWNQVSSAYDDLVFEITYDALDRPTQVKRRDPGNTLSSTRTREYDGRSLVTKLTDALGNTTHREWDGRGLLKKIVRDLRVGGTGAGAVTSTVDTTYAYDAAGRVLSIKDGKNQATTYEYDARSRVTKETNAAGNATTIAYDAAGNPTTITQPTGTVVTQTYDVVNRLTAESAVLGAGVVGDSLLDFTYDALGRVAKITDNDSTIERAYDSLSRLVSETQGPKPLGTSGKTFQFGYDAASRVTSVTYPDGTVENRNRDAAGRLSSVSIQGGATLATYKYAGSRIPQVTLANSVVRTQTFDALHRVTHVEYTKNSTSLRKFEYVFELEDHRLLEKRHHANGTGDNYTLDSLYRTVLVKAGVADPVLEHQTPGSQTVASTTTPTYDAAGSRTQVAVTSGGATATTNYSADALNFYTSVGGTTHVRDANGNLTDDGTLVYAYDYRNRLVKVTKKSDSSVVATYEYDGIGRRIAKQVVATQIQFYWIGFSLAMEYDGQGLVSRRHVGASFGDVVSANQRDVADLDLDGSTTDFVGLTPVYDGAFDCAGVLDHTGAVAESYVHTYEGAVTITNASGTPIATSAIGWQQGYGRMYRDAETALLYSVFRYYAPALGRFVTEDPLGRSFDPSGLGNGYSWAGSTYRNAWDPLGLKKQTSLEKATAGIVAVMRRAASEAGGSTDFTDNINDKSIEWKGGLSGNLGAARRTDSGYRVRINIIVIFRRGHTTYMSDLKAHLDFADVIAHELEHIRRFKCGEKSPHHPSKKEAEAYNRRGKKEGDRLRKKSKTLRLFEAWLEHLRKKGNVNKQVAKAAANALKGTPVPKPKPKK